MSSKSFKSLVLLFMFTSGIISGKVVNFAACMEGPKKVGEGNVIKLENGFDTEEAKGRIKEAFLGCCDKGAQKAKYEEKVDYFLYLLEKYGYFNEELISSTLDSISNLFEVLGDKGRAIFADLWKIEEFDLVAVAGFFCLFSYSYLFRLSGSKKGLSLFLEGCNNNLELVAWFFRVLGKYGDKMSIGFSAFLGCVGQSDEATPNHSAYFDANLVFPSLLKLLLKNDGSIDEYIFWGLMYIISGFECDGDSLVRFVAILTYAKNGNNTVSAKTLAELLRQFACLKKNVAWASKNFVSILDSRRCEKIGGIVRYDVSYNVMEKIKDGSIDVRDFVRGLAAVNPEKFSSEKFAKTQGFEKVVKNKECDLCLVF